MQFTTPYTSCSRMAGKPEVTTSRTRSLVGCSRGGQLEAVSGLRVPSLSSLRSLEVNFLVNEAFCMSHSKYYDC